MSCGQNIKRDEENFFSKNIYTGVMMLKNMKQILMNLMNEPLGKKTMLIKELHACKELLAGYDFDHMLAQSKTTQEFVHDMPTIHHEKKYDLADPKQVAEWRQQHSLNEASNQASNEVVKSVKSKRSAAVDQAMKHASKSTSKRTSKRASKSTKQVKKSNKVMK